MKATILVRDLVKLIAKHGDLDVRMCIDYDCGQCAAKAELKCIDEMIRPFNGVIAFELYGEEK